MLDLIITFTEVTVDYKPRGILYTVRKQHIKELGRERWVIAMIYKDHDTWLGDTYATRSEAQTALDEMFRFPKKGFSS